MLLRSVMGIIRALRTGAFVKIGKYDIDYRNSLSIFCCRRPVLNG